MTEEDQLLVAKAALVGVRFWRTNERYWQSSEHPSAKDIFGGHYTIGRAAVFALWKLGMVTEAEHDDYFERTKDHLDPVDVDISALAGCQLHAEEPTP